MAFRFRVRRRRALNAAIRHVLPSALPFRLYLVLGTIVATAIGGGLCGGMGFAMYNDAKVELLSLWTFPETVVGDITVTCVVTGVVTTLVSSQVTKADCAKGLCNRLPIAPRPRINPCVRTLARHLHAFCPGIEPTLYLENFSRGRQMTCQLCIKS